MAGEKNSNAREKKKFGKGGGKTNLDFEEGSKGLGALCKAIFGSGPPAGRISCLHKARGKRESEMIWKTCNPIHSPVTVNRQQKAIWRANRRRRREGGKAGPKELGEAV